MIEYFGFLLKLTTTGCSWIFLQTVPEDFFKRMPAEIKIDSLGSKKTRHVGCVHYPPVIKHGNRKSPLKICCNLLLLRRKDEHVSARSKKGILPLELVKPQARSMNFLHFGHVSC